MPRSNKKRKAILLAIAARGLVAVEESISGPFVYSESEESLDESASECDDLEEEEQDEQDEQEIQDLVQILAGGTGLSQDFMAT
ncbi:hypothetical protein BDZ91DRAFT_750754 [Kalaharituber pfeilii]|nr:hypothetical protein BDZ91DRAFT_750754 [Kalaharituber pfeilii]